MVRNFKLHAALLTGLLVMALFPAIVTGQVSGQIAAGSIEGKVTDQSGASMPGVTVTATSPALQVPRVTTTTDAAGDYQLSNLPAPGVYRVSFEFAGFETLLREDLNLPVGFTAKVDASLKVGETTTSVEVSGESPVVDTTSSTRSLNVELQELQDLPRGGGMQELYPMAAGVTTAGKPDVADSNLGVRAAANTYGAPLNPSIRLEGMDLEDGDHSNNTGMYLSGYDLSEVQFKTSGQSADVANPGFDMESDYQVRVKHVSRVTAGRL